MIRETKEEIIGKEEIATDTWEIKFKRPEGFEYQAGQYVNIRVDAKITDGRGPMRAFSLSSSPNNKEFISTCFRFPKDPSEFKRYIIDHEVGTEVFVRGPLGKFTLPRDAGKSLVMIAGGVGVVPFVGMIRYATEIKSSQKIKLIYTDKSAERMAYYEELGRLEEENSNFEFIPRFERVNPEYLKETCDLKNSLFYICGTPGLIEGVTNTLKELGVLEEDIGSEKFSGY